MIALKHRILVSSLSILLVGLPLNTILVQFFVVKMGFPVYFALWKEVLAAILMLVCGWEIVLQRHRFSDFQSIETKVNWSFQNLWEKFGKPLFLVFLMTCVGILASLGKVDWSYILYGFRFELFWVWFWVILAVWGKSYTEKLHLKVPLLIGFFLSSLFSLVTIIFGTENTLTWLGYGQTAAQSGSDLLFTQPVGHLIGAGGWNSDFRLSSGFSSPNHYAVYLLLLMPLFLYEVIYRENAKKMSANMRKHLKKGFWIMCLTLDFAFLGLTYARFSYLALFVMLGVLLVVMLYVNDSKYEVKELIGLDIKNKISKLKNYFKNLIISFILAIPLVISVVVLNLPISVLQTYLTTFLSKPSSTEWHQQHTSAAFRALTLQTHPEILNQSKLSPEEAEKLNYLIQRSHNPVAVTYRIMLGYGMGTTDPASKYLPLTTNPIANLGFGLDDELYFPRDFDRPLALTPENWFLGLWVKGGIFYMLLFLAILVYFMRDLGLAFTSSLSTLQNPKNMLRLLVSLSIFGLTIGAFLLDIFDSQSLALLIGSIYLVYLGEIGD